MTEQWTEQWTCPKCSHVSTVRGVFYEEPADTKCSHCGYAVSVILGEEESPDD